MCYADNMKKTYHIIRPAGLKPKPDQYEERVAEICAEYFQSDIIFLQPGNKPTPDFKVAVTNQCWETKNIRGNSKYTIEDNLRKAEKQSPNVIISLLKPTSMRPEQALSKIKFFLSHKNTKIKHLLLITKSGKIIDIPV